MCVVFFFILPLSNELSSCSRGRIVDLQSTDIVERLLQSEGKKEKKGRENAPQVVCVYLEKEAFLLIDRGVKRELL